MYVEKVELGPATFSNIKAVIRDLALIFPDDDPLDGVLSIAVFNKCLLTLDYPRQRILLKKGVLPAADGKEVLAFDIQRLLPTLKISIGDVAVQIGIDSLSSTAGTLARALEAKVPLKATPIVTGQTRSADATVEKRMGRLKAMLSLGRHQIREPIVRFFGRGSVFAHDVLKHFAITFDQAGNRVRFMRASGEPITFPPLHSAGFGAELRDGARKVWYVQKDLPAQKAGLRVGDVIKAVNGRGASDYTPAAWRTLLAEPAKLTVTIEREGKSREITVKTAEFFR